MNLRLQAFGVIVALLLTVAFILDPGNPYLMAAFTFVAQPLLIICILMYFGRVFKELHHKDVLNLGLAPVAAATPAPAEGGRTGVGAEPQAGPARGEPLPRAQAFADRPSEAGGNSNTTPAAAALQERVAALRASVRPTEQARNGPMSTMDQNKPTRIVILGGGFGGVYTALHLQRLARRDPGVQITLVSRDNYLLMTPLLFEAGSGVLEPRHAVCPIRPMLKKARFVEAEVEGIDFERRVVSVRVSAEAAPDELPYDHLVIALGGITNLQIIPGSEHAKTFKFLGDAIILRNQIIDLLEWADVETDPAVRQRLLTFVVIGGGLVGVELMGELTEFIPAMCRSYPHVNPEDIRYHLIEAGPKLMPEMERKLADYATELLRGRGVEVLLNTPVRSIEPDAVALPDGRTIHSDTVLLAAGIAANPMLKEFPLEKDKKGRIVTDGTMRVAGYPEVWAIGDCASIPDPQGVPYPPLAQHALREAKILAANILAARRGAPLKPFVYSTLGMLASLGNFRGVGRVFRFKIRGFVAWWVWRSYYLMQMPRWERRLRIMLDWTVALILKNDIVKMDFQGQGHPVLKRNLPRPSDAAAPPAATTAAGPGSQQREEDGVAVLAGKEHGD